MKCPYCQGPDISNNSYTMVAFRCAKEDHKFVCVSDNIWLLQLLPHNLSVNSKIIFHSITTNILMVFKKELPPPQGLVIFNKFIKNKAFL